MLRSYQQQAIEAIRIEYDRGTRHQLVSMATGTGKTQIFSHLPSILKETLPGKTLVLAHRSELIDQAIDKMTKANPLLKVEKEMASSRASKDADIIVASVASLGRTGSSRAEDFDWDSVSVVITDECHHATSSSYTNVYERAGLLRHDTKKLHVGFTATPNRADGTPLATVFEKIVYTYDLRRAVKDGWLVDPCGVRVKTQTSLDGIKISDGDFAIVQLAAAVNTPQRNQLIVKAWLDNANGRKTIGFCADIQHSKDLADMFVHYGIKAEALWGDDPGRADKLGRLHTGETTIVLNCAVITEGFDEPSVSCVLMARPTKSGVLFTQCVGRATRLYEGKTDCIIIDVVDASSRNTLITLPTLMGLSAGLNLNGKGLYATLKETESAQKEYPHIDFTKLENIDDLKIYIENVNLFEVKFPAEVESNSELSWYPSPTGGYVMILPSHETGKMTPYGKPEKVSDSLVIRQNLLDRWDISGTIKGKPAKGERSTMEEAFSAADAVVSNFYPDALKILRRKESWHDDPATEGQVKLLKKFFKGKAIPNDLSKGAASKLISSYMAQR